MLSNLPELTRAEVHVRYELSPCSSQGGARERHVRPRGWSEGLICVCAFVVLTFIRLLRRRCDVRASFLPIICLSVCLSRKHRPRSTGENSVMKLCTCAQGYTNATLRDLAARASTGGLGRSVESKSRS